MVTKKLFQISLGLLLASSIGLSTSALGAKLAEPTGKTGQQPYCAKCEAIKTEQRRLKEVADTTKTKNAPQPKATQAGSAR